MRSVGLSVSLLLKPMRSVVLPSCLVLLAGLASTGCAGTGGLAEDPPLGTGPSGPVSGAGTVPERYALALEALEEAVRGREDQTADALLARLEARMERDPEAPEALSRLLAGYRLVLGGRVRARALGLSLDLVRPSSGPPDLEVWLCARSEWARPLELLPGALVLAQLHSEMDPRGRSGHRAELEELAVPASLVIPPGGSARWRLGRVSARVPGASLAARVRVDLRVRAARVRDGGRVFPADALAASPARHVELAGFLPTSPTPLEELAIASLTPSVGIAAWSERVVRLDPRKDQEAIEVLRELVATRATDLEILDRLAPALRWLLEGEAPGASPVEWRAWARAAQPGADDRPPTLDLPGA